MMRSMHPDQLTQWSCLKQSCCGSDLICRKVNPSHLHKKVIDHPLFVVFTEQSIAMKQATLEEKFLTPQACFNEIP